MKRLTLFGFVAICAFFYACSNQKGHDEAAVQDAPDSVEVTDQLEKRDVDNMVNIINTISEVVDSIQLQENMIFSIEEGTPKGQVVEKLRVFKELLAKKQTIINKLSVQNGENKKALANLQKMVDFMKVELEAKNKKITQLEKLVEKKDVSISSLRYNLDVAQKESDYLKNQNYEQDQELNAVYYIIGTKSELKEKGMMKGGFLSKKRTDYTSLNKKDFNKKDKRWFKELTIDSKKPKLITEKPKGSYTLTSNGDGTSTLKIVDEKAFWNASAFLIIQK